MKRGRDDSLLGADGQNTQSSSDDEAGRSSRIRWDLYPSNLSAARMAPTETTTNQQAVSSLLNTKRTGAANAATGVSSSSAAEGAATQSLNNHNNQSAASVSSPWSFVGGNDGLAMAPATAHDGATSRQLPTELLLRQLGTVAPPGVQAPHHEEINQQISSTLGQQQEQQNASTAEADLMDRLGAMGAGNLLVQQLQQQSTFSSNHHQTAAGGGFAREVLPQQLLLTQTNPLGATTAGATASLGVAQTLQQLLAEQQVLLSVGSETMPRLQNPGAPNLPLPSLAEQQQELANLLLLNQRFSTPATVVAPTMAMRIGAPSTSFVQQQQPAALPPLRAAAADAGRAMGPLPTLSYSTLPQATSALGRIMAGAAVAQDETAASTTNEREQLRSSLLSTLLRQQQQQQQEQLPPPPGQLPSPPPPVVAPAESLPLQPPSTDAPSSPPGNSSQHRNSPNEKEEEETAGFSVPLSVPGDHSKLSAFQILLREQVEVFVATERHVSASMQGRKKKIVLGQVGLRCRYCRARGHKSRGSVYYPGRLSNVYQACQNMGATHLMAESCKQVPPHIRSRLLQLRGQRDTGFGGKKYWAEACQQLGVYELPDGGLRLSVARRDQAEASSAAAAEAAKDTDDRPST